MKTLVFNILVAASATVSALAQATVQPADGPPQPTRFQQLEMTYVDNLKRVHAPLLQQYLGELKLLLDKSSATEAVAIRAEVARVQKMVADGGLIEFSTSKPSMAATPPRGSDNGIVFTLEPHEAQPPQSDDKPVPIGEATWTLSKLQAGNYDVVAHYSCESLGTSPVVNISFNGESHSREFKPGNVTKNGAFRVMRLCQLKVKQEATFQKFTVTTPPGGEPWLFVKQILIVKSKEPK